MSTIIILNRRKHHRGGEFIPLSDGVDYNFDFDSSSGYTFTTGSDSGSVTIVDNNFLLETGTGLNGRGRADNVAAFAASGNPTVFSFRTTFTGMAGNSPAANFNLRAIISITTTRAFDIRFYNNVFYWLDYDGNVQTSAYTTVLGESVWFELVIDKGSTPWTCDVYQTKVSDGNRVKILTGIEIGNLRSNTGRVFLDCTNADGTTALTATMENILIGDLA
jgi:hypothetical protein